MILLTLTQNLQAGVGILAYDPSGVSCVSFSPLAFLLELRVLPVLTS